MKIKELQTLIEKDSKVDIKNLDNEAINQPYLYGKYINIHAEEKITLKSLQRKMKQLKKDKVEYYKGNANPEEYAKKPLNITILKSQIPNYVESDSDVLDLQARLDLQEIKLEMLSEYLKSINQRSWNIRSAIDYIKFKHGV
jgi:hypothetical protein